MGPQTQADPNEELQDALRSYAKRMNDEYAPGGDAETLTPDAAMLDDGEDE